MATSKTINIRMKTNLIECIDDYIELYCEDCEKNNKNYEFTDRSSFIKLAIIEYMKSHPCEEEK